MGGKKANQIKKKLRQSFRAVRTWQLFLVLLPLIFLTATLLRFDHLKMVKLREAVLQADLDEDDEKIAQTLTELREFVYSHTVVNVIESNGVQKVTFGTGPFYLEHQYLRAANAAIEQAGIGLVDDSNPNGNIYAAAAAVCQPLAIANGWAWTNQGYLDCWMNELAKYPESDLGGVTLTANVPPTSLYRHDYASPIFSFTPAGILILVCAVLALIVLARLVIWCVLKVALVFLKHS